ncbi:MAG: DUF6152 family protein [Gammaproteobacteria bacterium]|jgi:hypothetical protein
MLIRRTLSAIFVGIAGFITVPATQAHHGWSGQGNEQFQLSGTLHTQVSFAGPHATMQVEDDMGRVWDITLAPPSRTSRAGLNEDTIPLGAAVTVSGHRNSSSDRREIKTERVIYNGRNYDVYPRRL